MDKTMTQNAVSPGMELIVAERKRQIEKEGWSTDHDDKYKDGELAKAGSCYEHAFNEKASLSHQWPWALKWWKPKDRVSNLVRAGALYLAEAEKQERKNEAMKADHWKARAEIMGTEIDLLKKKST